ADEAAARRTGRALREGQGGGVQARRRRGPRVGCGGAERTGEPLARGGRRRWLARDGGRGLCPLERLQGRLPVRGGSQVHGRSTASPDRGWARTGSGACDASRGQPWRRLGVLVGRAAEEGRCGS